MSKEVSFMYEAFVMGDDDEKKNDAKLDLQPEMGYLGKTEEARRLFEKIYRS